MEVSYRGKSILFTRILFACLSFQDKLSRDTLASLGQLCHKCRKFEDACATYRLKKNGNEAQQKLTKAIKKLMKKIEEERGEGEFGGDEDGEEV